MTVPTHRFCPAHAGPDPCLLDAGHDGDHQTLWGKPGDRVRPVMHWRGDEPWSHTMSGARDMKPACSQ